MPAPIAPLLMALALAATGQEGGASSPAGVASGANEEPPRASSEDLRTALDEMKALFAAGDAAAARARLAEVMEGSVFAELLASEGDVAIEGLEELAEVARNLSELGAQKRIYEALVPRHAERLAPEDATLLNAESHLAVLRAMTGDLGGALRLQEDVYERMEQSRPADDTGRLRAGMNLGATRLRLGDLEGALALLEEVHGIQATVLSAEDPALLRTKGSLAAAHAQLGDFERALVLQEHVHSVYERILPKDHPSLLRAKGNLGLTRHNIGDYDGALPLQEHVHRVSEEQLPADHPQLLRTKLHLALTLDGLREFDEALGLLEYVHDAWSRLLPPDHPDVLQTRLNLALTRYAIGDVAGAAEILDSVHAAWTRLYPGGHPNTLRAAVNLALLRRALDEPEKAVALLEEARAGSDRGLLADHFELIQIEMHLVDLYEALGRAEEAREVARAVLADQRRLASTLRAKPPRAARATALVELSRLPHALLASESSEGETAGLDGAIFETLEALRRVSTSSAEVAAAAARFGDLAQTRGRVARARRDLSDFRLRPPTERSDLAVWREELHRLGGARDRAERELRTALTRRGVLTEEVDLEAVANGLEDGAALVSFLRYQRLGAADPETTRRPPTVDSLLAFVVTPDAVPHRVDLGPAGELEELAASWRESLGQPVLPARGEGPDRGIGVRPSSAGTGERAIGTKLRRRLVDPCLAVLGPEGLTELHLVPDDFLHLVPFEALPTDTGAPLGEDLRVHTTVSCASLLPKRSPPTEGTLVAVGGVDFDTTESDASTDGEPVEAGAPTVGPLARGSGIGHFDPLPATAAEAHAVAEAFRARGYGVPRLLRGAEASKEALRALAPGARYLHVATHGWFAPESFASMIDGAAAAERDLFRRTEDAIVGFAPETLCGLALAGANSGPNAKGEVTGILTAEELAALDLSNCELAVLSACETNVGIRRAGQGIQSLQAALHAAGARTAITSLWKVDDAATRKLMELFYTRLWKDGLGKADALWRAKMALRAEGHPSRDWAGWTLTGDPD